LKKAIESNVPESEMPMIMIFSDMEFNQGTSGNYSLTAQEIAENKYAIAGYKYLKLFIGIYLVDDGNKPVKFDKNGALVSGFSPSLLSNLLGGKDMTPYSMMMNVIDSERYQSIII
jgi:hypothetical protein